MHIPTSSSKLEGNGDIKSQRNINSNLKKDINSSNKNLRIDLEFGEDGKWLCR